VLPHPLPKVLKARTLHEIVNRVSRRNRKATCEVAFDNVSLTKERILTGEFDAFRVFREVNVVDVCHNAESEVGRKYS
jgi:hypothetical protein